MHAVRKRILELLKASGAATVADLAEQLEMAPVSVRHHLDILQADNLIRVERLDRRGSVGRPQQIYALTEEAGAYFPNNYAALAAGLVRQLKQILPPDQVERAFQALGRDLAQPLEGCAGEPVEARLDRITAFLNARGYLASWEPAGSTPQDGYLLHKHNCPYTGISAEHGELCRMDQTMIDTLMGAPCRRTHSMTADDHCCTYAITPAAGDNELAAGPAVAPVAVEPCSCSTAGGCGAGKAVAPDRAPITLISHLSESLNV